MAIYGKAPNVIRVVSAIAKLGELSPFLLQALVKEISVRVERGEGEANLDVCLKDGRKILLRIFFSPVENGVKQKSLLAEMNKLFLIRINAKF